MEITTFEGTGKIYCITCEETGKKYIGQTTMSINTRLKAHIRKADLGTKGELYEDIRLYGCSSFSAHVILNGDLTYLNDLERMFIKRMKTYEPFGYNQLRGGGARGESCEDRYKPEIKKKSEQITCTKEEFEEKLENGTIVQKVELVPIKSPYGNHCRVLVTTDDSENRYRFMFNCSSKTSEKQAFDRARDFALGISNTLVIDPYFRTGTKVSARISRLLERFKHTVIYKVHLAKQKAKRKGEEFYIVRMLVETEEIDNWKDKKTICFGGSTKSLENAYAEALSFLEMLPKPLDREIVVTKSKEIQELERNC